MAAAHEVAAAGEAHVAGQVDEAQHRPAVRLQPRAAAGTHLADRVRARRVAAGAGGDEHATVADLDEAALGDRDRHGLAGEVGARVVGEAAEADLAAAADEAGDAAAARPSDSLDALGALGGEHDRRLRLAGGEGEALRRRGHADALVGTLGVVVGDPLVELGLRLRERGEDAAAKELAAQRLVEALNLAGGGRAARRGEQVADAVLAADAVEEHLARAGAEAAGEHLAVVGENLLGQPWRCIASMSAAQTGRAVARSTSLAETQKREWSSRPLTSLSSSPPSSFTPPMTSICQSSMGRIRSQRRRKRREDYRRCGSIRQWRTRQR